MNILPVNKQKAILQGYRCGVSVRMLADIMQCSPITIRKYFLTASAQDKIERRLNICQEKPKTKLAKYCKGIKLLATIRKPKRQEMMELGL